MATMRLGAADARLARRFRGIAPVAAGAVVLTFAVVVFVAAGDAAPSEQQTSEWKQDFFEFDMNKDSLIDAQEVRANFHGELDPRELHKFFIDVDKDNTGTLTLQEYIDYAVTLTNFG
mmetsp:Transcript_95160/g.274011  ORF Transcript_95160/g.274011 Transcript_95160/m.274011 type:complete len:118 (-) Transcript_95160:312-665(-)